VNANFKDGENGYETEIKSLENALVQRISKKELPPFRKEKQSFRENNYSNILIRTKNHRLKGSKPCVTMVLFLKQNFVVISQQVQHTKLNL
jgi:hypothetical protein